MLYVNCTVVKMLSLRFICPPFYFFFDYLFASQNEVGPTREGCKAVNCSKGAVFSSELTQ